MVNDKTSKEIKKLNFDNYCLMGVYCSIHHHDYTTHI